MRLEEARGQMGGSFQSAEVDPEEIFEQEISKLDAATKATVGFKKIQKDLDESGDYDQALADLRQFLRKRDSVLSKTRFTDMKGNEILIQTIQEELKNIQIAMGHPDAFLGNGAVAEVFSMRSIYREQDICVKVVHDYKMLAQGNSVDREMAFLDRLQDVHVAGVRCPMPYYSFSNMQMRGIAMEQLDAVNFRRVIDGLTTNGVRDELPKNFDIDDYFSRLREYLIHIHSMGITHGDIFLRNLMVSRTTGFPFVIDFGKARYANEQDNTNVNAPDFPKSDLAHMESAKEELKQWLEKKKA